MKGRTIYPVAAAATATIQRNKQKYKNKKGGSFFAQEQFFDKQA